jgi:cyclase
LVARRLIGVVPVLHGRVVKSYRYVERRPAGSIPTALINLDRWGADEIVLLDISRRAGLDPDVATALRETALSTPVTYGGGIRSVDDVRQVLTAGADRVLVESLLWDAPDEVARIADVIGVQAVVASLPVAGSSIGQLKAWSPPWKPSSSAATRPSDVATWVERIGQTPLEEVLVTDVDAEGRAGHFSVSLADEVGPLLAAVDRPVIWFGGLDVASAGAVLGAVGTTGVAFGNLLNEQELALPHLRRALRIGHPERIRAVRHSRG